jgi:hypothetical protein
MAAGQVPYLGVPAGRTGLFQFPEPIPGVPEGRVTRALQSGTKARKTRIPRVPPVTLDLSQWPPRLGVPGRERWGRPDRYRVPGATGPAFQSSS